MSDVGELEFLKRRIQGEILAIAVRAALRIVHYALFYTAPTAERDRKHALLPSLRMVDAAWFSVASGKSQFDADFVAKALSPDIENLLHLKTDNFKRENANLYAVRSAIDCFRASLWPHPGGEQALQSIGHSLSAAKYAKDAEESDLMESIHADTAFLDDGGSLTELMDEPLWPGRGMPSRIAERWSNLQEHLLQANEGWEVWIDWYKARLKGAPSPENPDGVPVDMDLEKARVLIPEEFWEEGPSAVNRKIRELTPPTDEGDDTAKPKRSRLVLRDKSAELNHEVARLREIVNGLEGSPGSVKELIESTAQLRESVRELFGRCERLRERLEEAESRAEAVRRQSWEEGDRLRKQFEEQVDSLAETYIASTTLAAPVSLWSDKEQEHAGRRNGAFRLFCIGLGTSLISIAVIVNWLIGGGSTVDTLISDSDSFGPRGVILIGAVLTVFTLLLWFTRLQMRIFLSERHLAIDARERRAFAQAYVAMLKGEMSALGDELTADQKSKIAQEALAQKQLVYAALFRPSTDGIVKEDSGLDPTISAAISKLLTSR